MQREFTEVLYELFVRQNLSLSHSLLIMSRKPKKDRVKFAAESIYSALENGSVFSSALKTCEYVRFNDVYISFILLAEARARDECISIIVTIINDDKICVT